MCHEDVVLLKGWSDKDFQRRKTLQEHFCSHQWAINMTENGTALITVGRYMETIALVILSLTLPINHLFYQNTQIKSSWINCNLL